MIAMVMTVYDGILSLIFQPIMAAIVSAGCVGVCLLIGLIFRVPAVGNLWRSSRLIAIGLALLSIFFMLCGSSMGLTQTYTDSETGRQFVGLKSGLGLGCYFLLLFVIANFPLRSKHPV